MTVLKFKPKTDHTELDLTPKETMAWHILADELTDAQVIADAHNVTAQTVRNVKMLKTKRAENVYQKMLRAGVDVFLWEPVKRFTDEEVKHIRNSQAKSHTLAKTYGCSPSTIRMIRTGKTYVR